jgi:hypothetical protein
VVQLFLYDQNGLGKQFEVAVSLNHDTMIGMVQANVGQKLLKSNILTLSIIFKEIIVKDT